MRQILISVLVILVLYSSAQAQELKASYYSSASLKAEGTWKHGEQNMANGKKFDENALTCATRLYPLGTHLRISLLFGTGSVDVIVTDRIGKRFATTRIDLSKRAFSELTGGKLYLGVVKIKAEVLNV
jgi:rare lipoprotein A